LLKIFLRETEMKNLCLNRYSHNYLLSLLVVMTCSSPLLAQNQFNLNELQAGQLVLNLSATEQLSVDQDTLNVYIQYSAQGRNTSALQNEVNEAMREALEILDATNNIEYFTQQYHVYNMQGRNNQTPTWRAQQSIQMSSINTEALLVVTARLQQQGLTVNSMNYSLSSEKYEEVSDSLMNAALQKLQARANEAASTLNKSNAALVEVSLNGGNNQLFRGARASMAMDSMESMAIPVAEPGTTQVSLTVSARALLSP